MMNKNISILSAEYAIESIVLRVAVAASLILVAAYLYFVGTSILNIIARKEALAERAKIVTVIANFERDYFALSEGISASSAVASGLVPVGGIAYIYRPGTVGQVDTPNVGL